MSITVFDREDQNHSGVAESKTSKHSDIIKDNYFREPSKSKKPSLRVAHSYLFGKENN